MNDLIANELIIASQIRHTNNVSKLASGSEGLGYQPILIMNSLVAGEKAGKFKYVEKKDIIKISEDIEDVFSLAVTDGLVESREQIELFIKYMNDSKESDVTIEEIHMLIPNLPELHLLMAVNTSKKLATYEYADPKDKQSVYTFVTLKENIDKQWGTKQFDASKSKAKKHAAKVSKK